MTPMELLNLEVDLQLALEPQEGRLHLVDPVLDLEQAVPVVQVASTCLLLEEVQRVVLRVTELPVI